MGCRLLLDVCIEEMMASSDGKMDGWRREKGEEIREKSGRRFIVWKLEPASQ